MKYGHIENGVVIQVVDHDPSTCFTPDWAEKFSEVPDEVEAGWTTDGSTFSASVPVEPILAAKIISPVEFKMLFTSAERIAIKASTDAVVQDFVSILEDPRLTEVNLSNPTVIEALEYYVSNGLLTEERKTTILNGGA